jgi:hypothetical protein
MTHRQKIAEASEFSVLTASSAKAKFRAQLRQHKYVRHTFIETVA